MNGLLQILKNKKIEKGLLFVFGLVLAFHISAQTITRQYGVLYRLYTPADESPYAEVFGCVVEEGAALVIPDSIVKDEVVYPVTRLSSYAFNNCKEIVSVKIGSNIKSISEGAFNECSNLQSVQMSDSIHSIGGYAFNRCGKLEEITFSTSLDYIFFSAFSYSGLKEVIFPASLKIIANDTFENCNNLQSITFQSDVRIDDKAFKGCENISDIYYNYPTLRDSYKSIFDLGIYKSATLYVPQGCLQEAYDKEPWLYFVTIKEIDFTTGFKEIANVMSADEPLEIYDLDGIKYNKDFNNLRRGIYVIREGNITKKILIE